MEPRKTEFDNESSLRAARKSLPFAKLWLRVVQDKSLTFPACPFCAQEGKGALLRKPVVTKKIEKASIEAVEAIDIVKVVQANLQLKRQGANWVACCPFHNEKNPSFNVHPAKNTFKCFGCKEGGGPIHFIRKMAGLEFVPAVEKLAGEFGIQLRYETHGEKTVWHCTEQGCASGGAELDEVAFVGKAYPVDGKELSRKEAFKAYLKLAEVIPTAPVKPEAEAAPVRFKPKPKAEEPVLPNPVLREEKPEPESPAPAEKNAEEELLWSAIEVLRKEGRASVALLHERLKVDQAEAARLLTELEKRGHVGPAKGAKPREVLKLPKARPQIIKIKIGDETHEVDVSADSGKTAAEKTGPGEEFAPGDGEFTAEETPEGILLGRAALEYFYAQQILLPADDDALWRKRGLETRSNRALGNVSSQQSNYDLLHKMRELFSWEELVASGLWLPEDKKEGKERRPNSQFCGYGQIGKKAKEDRKNKNDKAIWGYCYPILIPFFDEAGKILKLRAHKGGAPGSTLCGATRLYVPRDYRSAADTAENFYRCIVTEGEHKAQALWQTLGAGALDLEPSQRMGVAALPGITYGKNYDIREELEAWLRSVRCQIFEVVFDDEDKSDREREDRYEAIIWAKYLAASVAKKLGISGRVCVLPRSWRMKDNKIDVKGKADWDSRVAHLLHGKTA